MEEQLSPERGISGSIPGNFWNYILLLWLFRKPIVAFSIKKAHRLTLPVTAINIGALVPILLITLLICYVPMAVVRVEPGRRGGPAPNRVRAVNTRVEPHGSRPAVLEVVGGLEGGVGRLVAAQRGHRGRGGGQ